MDKRSYSLVASPNKVLAPEIHKKIKISLTPKKQPNENNGNLLNSHDELNNELDGLCFDDDDSFCYQALDDSLDLSQFKRCVVCFVERAPERFETILTLRDKKSQKSTKCCLKGPWYDTFINSGDIVSAQGVWSDERNMFLVSATDGLIVTNPDTLVSGTTVVGSLFCARKSALTERFRGIDCGSMKIMNIGSIVHEILQTVLRKNFTTLKEIKKAADAFLQHENTIQLLYSCKMTLSEMNSEIEPFITRIHEFVRQYVIGDFGGNVALNSSNQNQKPFAGRISEIQDIEENVWCPRLGLKGKIDVTVKINPPNKFFNSFQKLMPLEIKTGKASFSMEHKGQLIIYQMMMQDLGKQIDSGLLLYIREGIMSEVGASKAEKRGLIQMRNRLAHYLSIDLVTREKKANLPEPINHHSACQRCEYNTICCTFLKSDGTKLSENHSLTSVKQKVLSHLNDDHIDYFLHWCHLITLEHNEAQKSIKLRHIWTKDPSTRAAKGSALINLIIKDLVHPQHDEFIHKFGGSEIGFTTSTFDIGEYLIVSTDTRCSIAAGRVTKLEPDCITLTLPRDLSHQYSNCRFHLDRYESQSQSVFNFSNIGALLEPDENVSRLRQIIIDKTPAVFGQVLPKIVIEKGERILLQLNSVQRCAVLKALTCENYMLIKGLPGTGKTQTLVALIQLLMIMKKSVVITSHTNSAVDNILLRLMDRGINFMRLGSATRIHPLLLHYRESELVANCKTVEDLEQIYNKQQIVAVTCLGSSHALLSQRKFDFCLVDEATQIFQPTVIRPLIAAEKFILVGDPKQLAPLVRNSDGRTLGADESLFERLDSLESTMVLGLQYRMNRVITKLANNLTYEGQLKCANQTVEKAAMNVPNIKLLNQKFLVDKWLARALSNHIDQSCTFINTGDVFQIASQFAESVGSNTRNDTNKLYVNYCEIAVVLHIVDLLIECGVTGDSIGVIAPYRGQVDAMKTIFSHHSAVEVNTVDQYQGRDKKIIIYSCTKSKRDSEAPKSTSEVEILEDRRRLTVAITRAKHKLIMVGDVNCLNSYTPFRDLLTHMNSVSKIKIEEGKLGFSWENLLNDLKPKL